MCLLLERLGCASSGSGAPEACGQVMRGPLLARHGEEEAVGEEGVGCCKQRRQPVEGKGSGGCRMRRRRSPCPKER